MIDAFKTLVIPEISECIQKIQREHEEYWVDFQRALKHQIMNQIWKQELDLQPSDFKSPTRMARQIESRIASVVNHEPIYEILQLRQGPTTYKYIHETMDVAKDQSLLQNNRQENFIGMVNLDAKYKGPYKEDVQKGNIQNVVEHNTLPNNQGIQEHRASCSYCSNSAGCKVDVYVLYVVYMYVLYGVPYSKIFYVRKNTYHWQTIGHSTPFYI